jgi:DNA-binding HxlR family transcriptional regulator
MGRCLRDGACAGADREAWALLVLRELLLGPQQFPALRAGLSVISANVLSPRVKELESRRSVRWRKLLPPASMQVNEATEWGLETARMIREMGRARA